MQESGLLGFFPKDREEVEYLNDEEFGDDPSDPFSSMVYRYVTSFASEDPVSAVLYLSLLPVEVPAGVI